MIVNERVVGAILTMLGAGDVLSDAGVNIETLIGPERDEALGRLSDEIGAATAVFDKDANLDVAKRLLVQAVDTLLAEQTAAKTSETSETEVASE